MIDGPRAYPPQLLMGAVLALLCLAGIGWAAWSLWARPAARAERLLERARSLHASGEDEQAERSAAAALEIDPRLGEAALLAAECAAAEDAFARAVEYLQRARPADHRLRVRAALVAAELYENRLHQLGKAEEQYRAALEIDPDDPDANAGLAKLLGLCARADEAVPHVLRLVRQGEPTDLLILIGRENAAIGEPGVLKQAREAAPADPNPLIGLGWHAANANDIDQAIKLLQDAIHWRPDCVAAHVALGRHLLAARRLDELIPWANKLPAAANGFAQTWLIRATLAEDSGDAQSAIRCYWEAARRSPESKAANFRLARLLAEAGETEASERFAERVRRLQDLENVQNRFVYSSGYLLDLAQAYESAGRLWEAYAWSQAAVRLDPDHSAARHYTGQVRNTIHGLPLRQTLDSANVALAIDLSGYPLPRFHQFPHSPHSGGSDGVPPLSFRNDAASSGLRFRYFNGAADRPTRRMFEFTGGGIGVLDFDVDGYADVYFTQGRPWPPDAPAGEYGDRVFRNIAGARFDDVTASAGVREGGFGQGVTVGDFNSDGFPDLYVANIGRNRLWRNNGDGTLSDVTDEAGLSGGGWTTSCVLADLNGDALPDLYDVNYLAAPDVFDRVCKQPDGSPALCMPFHFDGEADRLWLNEGDGRFTDATADVLSIEPRGKGLGVAVWDAHGTGRLSLLVANDTTPCFFFVGETRNGPPFRLEEQGIPSGLALNGDGKATGCMGIALGDIDNDGRLDVHVTNFLAEANTLFVNPAEGTYVDRTRALGLHGPTFDVLGFGTQFLDADLDGRLELFVSNGHVDDLRAQGKPYAMPPQLFRFNGSQFIEVAAGELGPYFEAQWLGRPVARLDWNRDGREDLAVGHLGADSALLTNTTRDPGRFLSIKLFGVQSNRDAIGTMVRARIGERTIVRQLTAGDGYQASNERRLVFGMGGAEQIDELVVRWPSGTVQQFTNVPISREVCLVEGRALLPVAIGGNSP